MKGEAVQPVAKQGKPKRVRGRHVPMRTCIGTRTQHAKRDMIRLVKTEEGHIVIDLTGKRAGSRGAYLSRSRAAAEQAIRQKRFEAEFDQPLLKEDEEAILAVLQPVQLSNAT